ncbi:MAG TPA: hypothetical protein VGR55_14595 [Candidatus Acidoferrum sp.]|nr:hypothetical protein [Candidatus Acidoferrum sp.]
MKEKRQLGCPSQRNSKASSWIGQIGEVSTGSHEGFALVSVDEEAATEREKLDAAYDEIGLSQLIAAGKLLLVADGTPVRILEVQATTARCQVRILKGEHYGKTALVPLKWLAELE